MFEGERAEEIIRLLKEAKAKKVLVQVPEGLKTGVQELADLLGRSGMEPVISAEPCFGACDLRDREAKALGCDTLLHVGHADLKLKTAVKTVYYEYPIDYDFVRLLGKFMGKIHFKSICVVSTVQFRESAKGAKAFLEKNGLDACDGGHILGCDASQAKKCEPSIDAYLFIGSGRFHPLGLQEKTEKPVLFLDVENQTLDDLSREKGKMEIKRKLRIEKARSLETFGILVSTKPGQMNVKKVLEMKGMLETAGKKAYVIAADFLSPDKLLGLKLDALINTACPRMRDDAEQFGKTVLNPGDVDEMLAQKTE